ncbi:conserved hypothetical protein [Coccidioides posadasii str. Silveira]|uniref:Uncharacterized protein n=1 Tax=Coccidioides posadasii (strain RMSCC 757 / Silveira) TaxID=443226 RepID=E9DJQ4_COCPS|nr:conserved hypothetical protein [Coccidioides posadasii str. Silveira]
MAGLSRHTFIRSHWILPYPSTAAFWARGKGGKLRSWASTHSGLVNYLQQYQPELTIIEPDMIDELPLADWKAGGQPLPLDVALPSVPSNLDAWLAIEQGQHPVPAAMSPNPAVFLLAVGVRSSKLSRHLQATMAEHHVLRSFTQKEGKSASQLHTNRKWLTSQLVLHIQALVEAERQQVQSMDLPRATRSWQSRPQAQPNSNLTLVGPRMTRMDLEEDSDPESLVRKQEKHARRQRRMQQRLKVVQREAFYYNQCRTAMKAYQCKAAGRDQMARVANQSEFEKARVRSQKAIERLAQVSQQVTQSCRKRKYIYDSTGFLSQF